jgi:Tol biopolymer transport system component
VASETAAQFAAPGYLLRVVDEVLVAHRFDPDSGTLESESLPVAQSVGMDDGTFHSAFSVSDTGVLVHRPGGGTKRQLVRIDRTGALLENLGSVDVGVPSSPELSFDGRRLAMTRAPEGTGDIWWMEVSRNVQSRLTFDPGVDGYPVWSPDGDSIIFASGREGRMDLYLKAFGDAADERPLLASELDKVPQDWSPDDRFLLYTTQDSRTGSDLWAVQFADQGGSTSGTRALGEPFPVAQSGFDEGQARFSPDGQWIAYVSNETGRQEVYVQPFPVLNRKWQISIAGGISPQWANDGSEIFFVAPDLSLMAVSLDMSLAPASITEDMPRALFQTQIATTGPYVFTAGVFAKAQYTAAPDGNFLMIVADDTLAPPITVFFNWRAAIEN